MGWGKTLGVGLGSAMVLGALVNMTKKNMKKVKKIKILK